MKINILLKVAETVFDTINIDYDKKEHSKRKPKVNWW